MQKSCFGNRQFIQVLFFLTYNKPLDITNQGFILIHSTTAHIKDQKRTLSYKQSETAYGVGGRETVKCNPSLLFTDVHLPLEKKKRGSSVQ